jgi:hypothetical protein
VIEAIADGIDRLLAIPIHERRRLAAALGDFVRQEWSWRRTADALLAVAGVAS